jgi:GNAT superfamily N-acetyltransferase
MTARAGALRIRSLGRESHAAATAVLSDAFAGYPVMRYVLGREHRDRSRLTTLVGFFVTARLVRGDLVLGADDGRELCGVALVTLPDTAASDELGEIRQRVWATLGTEARERYEAFSRACEPFAVEPPHLHLNMLGVPPSQRGRGIGRRLLERVHAASAERADSAGVSLTTEDPSNLPFYERFGYHVVGRARVAPGLESWGFFRQDPPWPPDRSD